MKRILIFLMLGLCMSFSYGQNDYSAADDADRISITPYIAENLNFNSEVKSQLMNKINRMLTENGSAGIQNGRFILTANIDVVSEDIVTTITTLYQYELRVNFYVGDGIDGILFSSASQKVKGLGETKADAYIKALKSVKPGNTAFRTMVEQGKQRILEYYNAQCDFIIREAKTYASNQEYEAAISKLVSVPVVCSDCYTRCMDEAKIVFQAKIDKEGESLYAQASAAWSASQNQDGAMQAGRLVGEINPESKAFEKGTALIAAIEKYFKDLDQREWDFFIQQHQEEWDFILKQQQDAVDLENAKLQADMEKTKIQAEVDKAEIAAMRDIGVAYSTNQQPVTYNIAWW